jgi:thiol-disulfide isomerase/thioredoxin
MVKTFFKTAALLYIFFAIWTAYISELPRPTSWQASSSVKDSLSTPERDTLNGQQSSDFDRAAYSEYTVRVWTASWCSPCKQYKAVEIPKLIAMGFKVEVLDTDVDKTPKYIRSIPTVELVYEGKTLKRKTYWKAQSIEDFVTTL